MSSSANAEDHLLSAGSGIASPSFTSSLWENPAGLPNNQSFSFFGNLGSENNNFNPFGYGGGIFLGNGTVGTGIAIQGSNDKSSGNNNLSLRFGLGAEITGTNVAIGVNASHGLQNNGGWDLDAGLIYNPKGDSRIGVTLYSLMDDVNAVGLGWVYDLSQVATFTVDASYATKVESTVIEPSLYIRLPGFHMTMGYGILAQGTGWNAIREGFTAGLGIPLQNKFTIQGYYNHLSQYYAGLAITL